MIFATTVRPAAIVFAHHADAVVPHGQRIDLPDEPSTGVAFLGLATNGPSAGTATVRYTDGSTRRVDVAFPDWAAAPSGGATELVTVRGRNNADGSAGERTFRVFASRPVPLDPAKVVDAVVLPEGTDRGLMHVFDVATAPGTG